jgi:hypothetical protein
LAEAEKKKERQMSSPALSAHWRILPLPSKLRVIDPAEGNRIDLLHGFDQRSLRKRGLNVGHTARRMHPSRGHRELRNGP